MCATRRVLIVEDEGLLALEMEEVMTALGHEVTGVALSLSQALKLADGGDYDFAVLDISLAGHYSFPVAEELINRGVPFIFVTAYSELISDKFRNVPFVKKPAEEKAIEAAMTRALDNAGNSQ